ncbi:hypothetical protein [Chitinivorax sp. B]|uniref:hypothetical protein n=1 Tax=Chitinivorax sp. B TaxID=2502235 RepID=UPI0010FA13DC|nr:hypothetical protein [Chitinivorax sp. B]
MADSWHGKAFDILYGDSKHFTSTQQNKFAGIMPQIGLIMHLCSATKIFDAAQRQIYLTQLPGQMLNILDIQSNRPAAIGSRCMKENRSHHQTHKACDNDIWRPQHADWRTEGNQES